MPGTVQVIKTIKLSKTQLFYSRTLEPSGKDWVIWYISGVANTIITGIANTIIRDRDKLLQIFKKERV